MNVKNKHNTTELENILKKLRDYCEENGHPLFAATWQQPSDEKDDGYVYEYVPPRKLDINMEELTGEKDRFPMFLGAIMGFNRDDYKG